MKTFIIIFMIVILFTTVSVWNYRRFMPKPIPLGNKKYKVVTRQITIPVNGKNIYGELLLPEGVSGKLPTVICSHGYGSSYKLCKLTIGKGLAMSGYAAYCFDFYGGSKKSKSGGSMMEMSIMTEKEELLAVIDYIKKLGVVDKENLYLFGESQGGMVSGITAVDRIDDLKAMVLYYPAFCIPDDAHKKFAGKEAIPEKTEAFNLPISRKYYLDAWDLDVFSYIPAFEKPVFIIHGDADTAVDVSYGRRAAEVYKNAEYVELPGEIHGFMGKGKKEAAKLTYQFLESVRGIL